MNAMEHAKFIRGKETCILGKFVMCVDMPLIAIQKDGNISNGEQVTYMSPGKVMLKGSIVDVSSFDNFRYCFAETVWRVLGDTIPRKYNIHELHMMNWHLLYVALSRCTDYKLVGFAPTLEKKFNMIYPPKQKQITLHYRGYFQPKCRFEKAPTFSRNEPFKGIIYHKYDAKIVDKDYYGCTIRTTNKRDTEHYMNPTNKEMELWLHDPKSTPMTEEVSSMYYLSRDQLLKEEKRWTCQGTLNFKGKVSLPPVVKLSMPEVQLSRFPIKEEEAKKRYAIQYRYDGELIRKRFPYNKMSKAEAYALALVAQVALLREHSF